MGNCLDSSARVDAALSSPTSGTPLSLSLYTSFAFLPDLHPGILICSSVSFLVVILFTWSFLGFLFHVV